jgi:hypothetical protein
MLCWSCCSTIQGVRKTIHECLIQSFPTCNIQRRHKSILFWVLCHTVTNHRVMLRWPRKHQNIRPAGTKNGRGEIAILVSPFHSQSCCTRQTMFIHVIYPESYSTRGIGTQIFLLSGMFRLNRSINHAAILLEQSRALNWLNTQRFSYTRRFL